MKFCVVPRMAIESNLKNRRYIHWTYVFTNISKEDFCILVDMNPEEYPFEYNLYSLHQEQGMRLQPYLKHKLDFTKNNYTFFATNSYEPYTEKLAEQYPVYDVFVEVRWFLDEQIIASELLKNFSYKQACRLLKRKANSEPTFYRSCRVHRDYARILQPYMQHKFDFEKYKYYISTNI